MKKTNRMFPHKPLVIATNICVNMLFIYLVVFLLIIKYHLSSWESAGRKGEKVNQVTDGLLFETRIQLWAGVRCSRAIPTAGLGCSSTAAAKTVVMSSITPSLRQESYQRSLFPRPCHQWRDLLYRLYMLGLSCTEVLRRWNATHFHRIQGLLNDLMKSGLCHLFLSHESHQTPNPKPQILFWKMLKPAKFSSIMRFPALGKKNQTTAPSAFLSCSCIFFVC